MIYFKVLWHLVPEQHRHNHKRQGIVSQLFKQFLVLIFMALFLTGIAQAEPVFFEDANLKAAVEAKLGITDPEPEDMLALKFITIQDGGISSLAGLEHAINLDNFSLSGEGNTIKDLSPLTNLTELTSLTFVNGEDRYFYQLDCCGSLPISDLSPLAKLTKLERLRIINAQIKDISPLQGLLKLEYLNLPENQITDIRPLSGLTELRTLKLNANNINDLTPLNGLIPSDGNLKSIDISLRNNQISDLSALENIAINISRLNLDIRGNPLSCLAYSSQLHTIIDDYRGNRLSPRINSTQFDPIPDHCTQNSPLVIFPDKNLKRLVEIILDIENPTQLHMKFLRNLSDSSGTISDLTGLEYAINLYTLKLYMPRPPQEYSHLVSDLTPLAGLKRLYRVILSNGKIHDLTPLSELSNLTWIFLDNNEIEDLSPLANLRGIWELRLAGNRIKEISPLLNLKKRIIHLDKNELSCTAYQHHLPTLIANNPKVINVSPAPGPTTLISGVFYDPEPSHCNGDSNQQQTITFEDIQLGNYNPASALGFNFTPSYGSASILNVGSHTLSSKWSGGIKMTKADDSTFDLAKLDIKGRWPSVADQLMIFGTFADGSTQEKIVFYQQPDLSYSALEKSPWIQVDLGWQGLENVVFHTPAGEVLMDNFVTGTGSDDGDNSYQSIGFEQAEVADHAKVSESGFSFLPSYHAATIVQDQSKALSSLWAGVIYLQKENGQPFSLRGLKLKGSWPIVSDQAVIKGTFADGSVTEEVVNYYQPNIHIDQIPSTPWVDVDLNWKELKKVEFYTPNGQILMDEINLGH